MTTLDEVRKSNKEYLTPKDVAPIIGCHPYTINVTAKEDLKNGTNRLGFPINFMGTRVRIPRLAFIASIEGKIAERS